MLFFPEWVISSALYGGERQKEGNFDCHYYTFLLLKCQYTRKDFLLSFNILFNNSTLLLKRQALEDKQNGVFN